MPGERAEALIKAELGIDSLGEVFDWIELQEPLGSASISQVGLCLGQGVKDAGDACVCSGTSACLPSCAASCTEHPAQSTPPVPCCPGAQGQAAQLQQGAAEAGEEPGGAAAG
jgi:hypothetical protein